MRAMEPGVLAFVAFRIVTALPVLRWPLAGGLLAIGGDLADLLVRDLLGIGGVDYQLLDKALDQVYLLLFLVVALRWEGVERRVSVALYLYRLVGSVLFLVTDERALLLLFPNVFEPWFLLVALLHHRREPIAWTPGRVGAALAAVTAIKLVQEWALHWARVFDGMSALEFLDRAWRWLVGGG